MGNDRNVDSILRRYRILEPVEASFSDVMILGYAGVGPIGASHRRINSRFYSLSKTVLRRHRWVVNNNGENELVSEVVAP